MKKVITLLFACLLMTKVFAGPSLSIGWNNYTQNISGYGGATSGITVGAIAGDSVSLYVYVDCGMGLTPPYQWFFNGDSIMNSANTISLHVIIYQPGIYSASICTFMGVTIIQFSVNYTTTSLQNFKNINFLNVFPTAVTSSITIQLNSIKTNDVEISFFDMNGRQLKNDFYKNIVGEFIKNENTEALAKGIYFLRIKAGEDLVEKKFVKM